MLDRVKRDILAVLKLAQKAIKREDAAELKRISDMTIHNSSTYQDVDSISIAVLMYSLYKICQRCFSKERQAQEKEYVLNLRNVQVQLKKAYSALNKNNYGGYNAAIKEIFQDIKNIEKEFGQFINEVLTQSKIKKGSKIYEHGISAGRVAEIMGVSVWELQQYLGHTKSPEQKVVGLKPTKQRLNDTRKLFGLRKK